MELNKSTWQTSLFKWFFNMKELPDNLCPYFWGLVVMYICIIPYALIVWPYYIAEHYLNDDADNPPTIVKALLSFIIYVIIFMVFCMIFMFFTDAEAIRVVGSFGWLATIILVIFAIVDWNKHRKLDKWRAEGYPHGKPSLVATFIKAKYNKYCPIITWK